MGPLSFLNGFREDVLHHVFNKTGLASWHDGNHLRQNGQLTRKNRFQSPSRNRSAMKEIDQNNFEALLKNDFDQALDLLKDDAGSFVRDVKLVNADGAERKNI